MSSAARKTKPTITGIPAVAAAADYLGPADVLEVAGDEVDVELPDGAAVRARMALAFPYEPAPGDELLIIGRGADHYVIGVLRAAGRTELSFQGDVSIRASGGTVRIHGDEGVEVAGPKVTLHARSLDIVADTVVEKLRSLYQRIVGTASVHAEQMHTVVTGTALTQAKSAAIVTEETVTINGRKVHLG